MSNEQPPTPEQELIQVKEQLREMTERLQEATERFSEEKQQWLEREKELLEDSRTDHLTGALNRRGFDEIAKTLLPPARMEGQEKRDPSKEKGHQVVGIFDLDNLKKFNTDYGHPTTDKILKAAVGALRTFVRANDAVARISGDEFMILFNNASGKNITARLQDEKTKEWKMNFPVTIDGKDITISFSGGITDVGEDETIQDFETIYERADQALQHSKDSGKNRATHFEERAASDLSPNSNET
jgi:diguanylate cyclase